MAKILITGARGFVGDYLVKHLEGEIYPLFHRDCDLCNWADVKRLNHEVDVIVNCAFVGKYGEDLPMSVERNIAMITNLRRRYPQAKLISFGSGAMYDKSKPIELADPFGEPVYPKDKYGLAKRLIVDLSDVTLIPFGIKGDSRFCQMVKNCIEMNKPVTIFQDVLFSWVNIEDLPRVIEWSIKSGYGKHNLCGYNMTLTDMARSMGAKSIRYLRPGFALEYTGRKDKYICLSSK